MKRFLLLFCFFVTVALFGQTPEFEWAAQMGGSSEDFGTSIATDTSGNVYITGAFRETADFDPSAGVYNLSAGGEDTRNTFVAKYDMNGGLLWAFALNSERHNTGEGIYTDLSGNVYVTGTFGGTVDFDPGSGIYNLSSMQSGDTFSSNDIFILKLDTNGSLMWAVNMGASGGGRGESITVDGIGNVYATGYFRDTVDFDPGPDTFYLAANGFGDADIFVSKLDSNGAFVWARSMKGGSGFDWSNSIALDSSNNVYTTGYFKSNYVDFDPGPDTFLLTLTGEQDMFISKLSTDGDFIWAKHIAGEGAEVAGRGIDIDEYGNVYTTGHFKGEVDFEPGLDFFTLSTSDNIDCFITKLNENGDFVWAKSFGSDGDDGGLNIKLDNENDIYVAGSFKNTVDFDPSANTFLLTSVEDSDAFILKLMADASFIWAGSLSGSSFDHVSSLVLDIRGNIYTTGGFNNNIDFDPGDGIDEIFSFGDLDLYIHKMKQPCLSNLAINSPISFPICSGDSVSLSAETSSPVEEISYFWSTTDTTAVILVVPDTSSTYMVTATYLNDSSICTLSDSIFIFVNELSDTTEILSTTCDSLIAGVLGFIYLDQNGCDSVVVENVVFVSTPEMPIVPLGLVIQEEEPPFQISIGEVPNATSYEWTIPSGVQILSGAGTNIITVDWNNLTTGGLVCVTALNECGSSPESCMSVTVDIVDGVCKLNNRKYHVFPNPTNTILNIVSNEKSQSEFTLLDVLGREVIQGSGFGGDVQINVSELPSGVYWLKIMSLNSEEGKEVFFWKTVEVVQ